MVRSHNEREDDNMDDGRYGRSMTEWGTRIRKEAREYRLSAIGETQLIDLAGQLRSIEKGLAADRLAISSEFAPGSSDSGRKWTAKTGRVGQQSYNPPAIFTTAQAHGLTLMDLVESGALTLKWGMTKLRKFFADNNMELRQVGHELDPHDHTDDDDGDGDGEGPHLGLWYKSGSTTSDSTDEG